jgi:hypothetical protein
MKQKKGAIEISFNWIFVMIAGAVILLFFISLVNTQREKSEINIALTIKTELKSILTGASLSEARQLSIDLPKVNIKFICEFDDCDNFDTSDNPGCYSQYEIGGTGVNEQTPSQILFAPSQILGKRILTWTLPWNVPFYVTNLLYITGTNVKYIFVNDGDESINLYNNFLKDANKVLLSPAELEYEDSEGNENFKFIFTNIDPSTVTISDEILDATFSKNINAIKVNTVSKTIDFYNITNGFFILKGSTKYLTSAEIWATIFSDDLDFYSCNMQKAFNRYHLIAKVFEGRSRKLQQDINTPARCESLYNPTGVNGLESIVMNSKIFADISIVNLNSLIDHLHKANQQTKESSCALIY